MSQQIASFIKEYKKNKSEHWMIALWESFQPLVYSMMRKHHIKQEQREDIKQEAFCLLLECTHNYEIERGVPFESYYKMHLQFWFLNLRRKKEELLVIDYDWENGCSMVDWVESDEKTPEQHAADKEIKSMIQDEFEMLTQKQQSVINMYYMEGLTMVQIAKVMECSYNVVCRHKDAAIKKLRKRIKMA